MATAAPAANRDVLSTDNEIISTELLEINNASIMLELAQFEGKIGELPERIEDDDTSGTWQDVIKDINALEKKIETTRESAKEPYLRASRIVDGFFFALSAPKAGQQPGKLQRVKNAISTVILAHLQRKELEERRKREAEAARLREEHRVAEEARRAAEQARLKAEEEGRKRAATSAAAKEAQAEADTSNLDARAFEAEQQAMAKPHEIASVRSSAGSLATPKVSWDFEITDMGKVKGAPLWPYITDAAKQQAIRAYLKANAPDRLPDDQEYQPLTGVRVFRRRQLQVR